MHVVIISDYETAGGAAVAASRLALGLCQIGERVTRIVMFEDGRMHPWVTISLRHSLPAKVIRRIRMVTEQRCPINLDFLDRFVLNAYLRKIFSQLEPDVINVHNIHGAVSKSDLLGVCAMHAPTVWTLHDMWSFTGRCPYNYDCEKFKTGCDSSCPSSNEHPKLHPLIIRSAWRQKKGLLAQHKEIVAVCPSKWLSRQASAGFWDGHHVECIPYGLPLDIYRPLSQTLARRALDVPLDRLVLLMSAQDLNERRKGGDLIVQALQMAKSRPVTLLTLGQREFMLKKAGLQIFPLGYVDHERTKVLAYNAADLLIHPAPVDNLPNVVMESIACGTPVVGFPIGGIPDMVRPGQTGWLADEPSAESLALALDRAIDELDSGADYTQSCRVVAESDYGLELQAQQYIKLFSSLNESSSVISLRTRS